MHLNQNKNFSQGKQQDAEEFLTFLLNGLHEEFLSLSKLIENVGKTNHFVTSSGKKMKNLYLFIFAIIS